MPNFHFIGKKANGEDIDGMREAQNRFDLAKTLRNEGIVAIVVERSNKKKDTFINKFLSSINKVRLKDLVIFTNNMSAMIGAGLSLIRSLNVLEKQSDNPKLKEIIGVLSDDINKGRSFSDTLSNFPKSFPPILISMVRAGEESGDLPNSLDLVSKQLNKSYELKRKMKGAMIYPVIIITLIIIIGILMMIFLVPTLSETFEELNAELPLSTQFIIGLSDLIINYIVYLLLFLGGFIVLLVKSFKSKPGKRIFSFILLHIPTIKKITKYANSALTMRTLSSLISSGVGMVESISIVGKILQNPYYKDVMIIAESEVQKGQPLSNLLQKNEKIYPVLVSEMIAVGEETGKLSEMLEKGASFFEGEVDAMTKNISTIVEPALMILIGIAVGFFAISMIQPMYSLSEFI